MPKNACVGPVGNCSGPLEGPDCWTPATGGCSIPPWLPYDQNDPLGGGADTTFSNCSNRPCDIHDVCYQTCNPLGRKACDDAALAHMLSLCGNYPPPGTTPVPSVIPRCAWVPNAIYTVPAHRRFLRLRQQPVQGLLVLLMRTHMLVPVLLFTAVAAAAQQSEWTASFGSFSQQAGLDVTRDGAALLAYTSTPCEKVTSLKGETDFKNRLAVAKVDKSGKTIFDIGIDRPSGVELRLIAI